MARKVTAKQKAWAKYYIVDYNATQAAIKAGYKVLGAAARGYELTHNPLVMEYVERLLAKLNKKLEIDALYVRQRLVEIDTLNVRDILTSDGSLLAVSEWPDAWCKSISGLEICHSKDGGGGIISKIKWPDKIKTIELLGRHTSVRAWETGLDLDADNTPALKISFDSAEPKGDVRTTNANP